MIWQVVVLALMLVGLALGIAVLVSLVGDLFRDRRRAH